jgi:hypothetical protein
MRFALVVAAACSSAAPQVATPQKCAAAAPVVAPAPADAGCTDCALFTDVGVTHDTDVAYARAALARADHDHATIVDCGDESGYEDFIGLTRNCTVNLSTETDAACRAVTAVFLAGLASSGAGHVFLTVDCHPGTYSGRYEQEIDAGSNAEIDRPDGARWFLWLAP